MCVAHYVHTLHVIIHIHILHVMIHIHHLIIVFLLMANKN